MGPIVHVVHYSFPHTRNYLSPPIKKRENVSETFKKDDRMNMKLSVGWHAIKTYLSLKPVSVSRYYMACNAVTGKYCNTFQHKLNLV